MEDTGSRKMSSHRSTSSLELVGEEEAEENAGGGRCVAGKTVSGGQEQGQGGSPMYVGVSDESGANHRSSGRGSSGGPVAPSAVRRPLTRAETTKRPSSSSTSSQSHVATVVVPSDSKATPSVSLGLTHRTLSQEGILSQEKAQQKQQEIRASEGRSGGEQWDEVVQRLEPPGKSQHSLDLDSPDLSSGSSQNAIKTEMEPLIMPTSSSSNTGMWNSNDSQVAFLAPMPPPQTGQLRVWPFESPHNASVDVGGDFESGNNVMDLSDMENIFHSTEGGVSVENLGTSSNVNVLGSSNADAGAGEGQPHRPQQQLAQPQAQTQAEMWLNSGVLAMEKVIIEPSRKVSHTQVFGHGL